MQKNELDIEDFFENEWDIEDFFDSNDPYNSPIKTNLGEIIIPSYSPKISWEQISYKGDNSRVIIKPKTPDLIIKPTIPDLIEKTNN